MVPNYSVLLFGPRFLPGPTTTFTTIPSRGSEAMQWRPATQEKGRRGRTNRQRRKKKHREDQGEERSEATPEPKERRAGEQERARETRGGENVMLGNEWAKISHAPRPK